MSSTATATRASPARTKPPAAKPATAKPAAPAGRTEQLLAPPAPAILVPPRNFPLHRLRRADENVRHTRSDAAVDELAASIQAHGLCQNLIGYEAKVGGYADTRIMVVGGGRRLMALLRLEADGVITEDAEIPVLIRDREMAMELSLAENIEHENMSPVDEFRAFSQLIDTGRFDATTLAARFGWEVRKVRQRLRLAELHPDILDALSERQLTLEAAMAYASAQSHELQARVFKQHAASSWERHDPARIKRDVRQLGADTGDRLYRFVGAGEYEAAGGGYDDGLFDAAELGGERRLTHPELLEALAHDKLDRSEPAIVREMATRPELAPTIEAVVRVRGLLLRYSFERADLPAPDGFVAVQRFSFNRDAAWKTVRNNRLRAGVAIGIDADGKVQPCPDWVFVEKDRARDIDPPPGNGRSPDQTGSSAPAPDAAGGVAYAVHSSEPVDAPLVAPPSSWAERERAQGIAMWQRRLAVPSVAGTALEGRTFYGWSGSTAHTRNDEPGQLIELQVWASDAEIAAQADAAAVEYDAWRARLDAAEDDASDDAEELAR